MRKNKSGNLFFKSALVAGLLVTGTCVANAKPMIAHASLHLKRQVMQEMQRQMK